MINTAYIWRPEYQQKLFDPTEKCSASDKAYNNLCCIALAPFAWKAWKEFVFLVSVI